MSAFGPVGLPTCRLELIKYLLQSKSPALNNQGKRLGKYLGIDYGSSRVGLAMASSDIKLALPFDTVAPATLDAVIKREGPFDAVVVGLPRSLDGSDTAQTLAVRRFCDDVLWRKLRIEPVYQDEAGTSSIA